MLSILAALSKEYGSGQNIVGARAGVAFIFIYSALYAVFFNSTLYTVAAEMFPQHLRGYGTGVAAFCQSVSGIWIGQVTPFAFDAITWKYYFVFIGSLLALGALYAFFLVETNNISWKKLQESLGTMLFLLIRLIPPLSRKEESRQQSTLKANGGIPAVSDSCYLNVNYIFQRCVLLKATQYVS